MQPTAEQQAAIDVVQNGDDLGLQARAGTGKTTSLEQQSAALSGKRGLYIAFNKSVATDAQKRFPSNVRCSTAHSLGFRAVGLKYKHRLNGRRVTGPEVARILGINQPEPVAENRKLSQPQLARIVLETVKWFCYSADDQPMRHHVPLQTGVDEPADRDRLASFILPYARKAWADITSKDGRLRFEHDHYLKIWQLSHPKLPGDFILLDEAQDTNPVLAAIFNEQTHMQRVLVGDRCQAIYGWRGSTDLMERFDGKQLYLSQSFRFGPAVAEEANKWLGILDASPFVTGTDRIPSAIGDLADAEADAILCWKNATAVEKLLDCHKAGVPVAIVGGGQDVRRLAEASEQLRNGQPCWHPELALFQTWAMVQDYVENDHGGEDLKTTVKLIDKYGADVVIDAIDRAVPENRARVTVSTAHKAKGREWDRVKVADDFPDPTEREEGEVEIEQARLNYVTVTRAKLVLDRGGLAWVDEYLAGQGKPAPVLTLH